MPFCGTCGSKVEVDHRFCPSCAAELRHSSAASAPRIDAVGSVGAEDHTSHLAEPRPRRVEQLWAPIPPVAAPPPPQTPAPRAGQTTPRAGGPVNAPKAEQPSLAHLPPPPAPAPPTTFAYLPSPPPPAATGTPPPSLAHLPPPPATTGMPPASADLTRPVQAPLVSDARLNRKTTSLGSKHRASFGLRATTALSTEEVVGLVRRVCEGVNGGGKSLLTTGWMNIGASVAFDDGAPLTASIVSGGMFKGLPLCTFPVSAQETLTGVTLTIGGLSKYRTHQLKLWHILPIGPKRIEGFDPYRRLLDAIADELLTEDETSHVDITEL